jgi:CheY-like chemotaxis protein
MKENADSTQEPCQRTILLADDAPDDAELTTLAFRRAGYPNPIHTVCRAEDAIHYLKAEGPFADSATFAFPWIVLLDITMPGGSGWEVLAWIREQPQFRLLPVIVFTGSHLPSDEEKALAMGASAYEIKPQSFDDLIKLVKKIAEFWLWSSRLEQRAAS